MQPLIRFSISIPIFCEHGKKYDQVYSNSRWNWDSETWSSANGLRHTFGSFEYIVAFVLSKQLLDPILPIAQCLQGELQEVYFGLKKIKEVNQLYLETGDKVEYTENVKKLADDIGYEEKMPRIIQGNQTRRFYTY